MPLRHACFYYINGLTFTLFDCLICIIEGTCHPHLYQQWCGIVLYLLQRGINYSKYYYNMKLQLVKGWNTYSKHYNYYKNSNDIILKRCFLIDKKENKHKKSVKSNKKYTADWRNNVHLAKYEWTWSLTLFGSKFVIKIVRPWD